MLRAIFEGLPDQLTNGPVPGVAGAGDPDVSHPLAFTTQEVCGVVERAAEEEAVVQVATGDRDISIRSKAELLVLYPSPSW